MEAGKKRRDENKRIRGPTPITSIIRPIKTEKPRNAEGT
jgi:hypothetical protein